MTKSVWTGAPEVGTVARLSMVGGWASKLEVGLSKLKCNSEALAHQRSGGFDTRVPE